MGEEEHQCEAVIWGDGSIHSHRRCSRRSAVPLMAQGKRRSFCIQHSRTALERGVSVVAPGNGWEWFTWKWFSRPNLADSSTATGGS